MFTAKKNILYIIALVIIITTFNFEQAHANGPIVVLGDSLSAGYGIDKQKSWVNLLQQKLKENNYSHKLINSSISGHTSSNGANRINSVITDHNPFILILALGSNDGLRGQPPQKMYLNLQKIISSTQKNDTRILLLSFDLPTNYGIIYRNQFKAVFNKLADKFDIPLEPFWLEEIALKPEYLLSDGIHPNEKAQPFIYKNIWQALEPML